MTAHLAPKRNTTGRRPGIEPLEGLVLSGSVVIARQLSLLLASTCGWHMHVVHEDRAAYACIRHVRLHAVIADIDASVLGGLPFLIHVRRHHPMIARYAITGNDDAYIKQLACDMAGCRDFFYLTQGKLMIDTDSGMAARLARPASMMQGSIPGPALAGLDGSPAA